MKNILLGTSALVGVALLAGAALAEDPKVMVGGVIDFQAGYGNNDATASGERRLGFRNDTEINISVEGKSDQGLGYGAVVDLEGDINGDADGQGTNAARTYLFTDGSFGRVELGSVEGAAQTMQVDAATVARATGGINGDWDRFASQTGAAFISRTGLPGQQGNVDNIGGDDSTQNAAKINYYSPRFTGFQIGASYTPNLNSRGNDLNRLRSANEFGNVFDVSLGYEGQFNNIGLKASGAYERGNGSVTAGGPLGLGTRTYDAYDAGAVVTAFGVNFAGSYGDMNNAYGAGTNASYWTAGAAYDFGPFGASVTWLDSSFDLQGGANNDFHNLVGGVDYALAPGLTPYVEVSWFNGVANAGNNNNGVIGIVGTQLAF